MLTASIVIVVLACVAVVVNAMGKCPLWIAVGLLCLLELLRVLPLK